MKYDAKAIEEMIEAYLPEETGHQKTVLAAMNYAVKAGGKRLRPMMLRLCYEMFAKEPQEALVRPFMAAMEMIHTYSLVHDDLPAMDNDEYRRGKKTTHVVYGEAMAILAGDDMEWQICNDDGSCLSGRLAATSDPNSFDLLDNDGADCGSVHLSYASRDGMDGILYVSHKIGDFKMRRTNRVPAFFEE